MKSSLVRNRSQQNVFAQHVIPGQARNVLLPANQVSKALILRKVAETERQQKPSNKMRSSVNVLKSSNMNSDQQS